MEQQTFFSMNEMVWILTVIFFQETNTAIIRDRKNPKSQRFLGFDIFFHIDLCQNYDRRRLKVFCDQIGFKIMLNERVVIVTQILIAII